MKNIRHLAAYFWASLGLGFLRLLPRPVVLAMAWIGGTFMYHVGYHYRNIAIANLRIAFPDKSPSELKAIHLRSFKSLILSMLDFFWMMDTTKRFKKYSKFREKDRKILLDAAKEGVSVIIVTPHLGNWELAGLTVPFYTNINFAVVARMMPNPYLNRVMVTGRETEGNMVIPAKGAGKKMIKALRDKYTIATLIDQNTRVRDGGLFVNFFGLPVPASRAPAMFAKKMNVKLVMGGAIREEDGNYYTFIEELETPQDNSASETEITQQLLNEIENRVRKHPEQYLWFYKRFQHIPQEIDDSLKRKFPFYSKMANDRFYSKHKKTSPIPQPSVS